MNDSDVYFVALVVYPSGARYGECSLWETRVLPMVAGEELTLFGHFRLKLAQSREGKMFLSAKWTYGYSALDLITGTSEPIYHSGKVAHHDGRYGEIRGGLIAEDDDDTYPFSLKLCRTLAEAGAWLAKVESVAG